MTRTLTWDTALLLQVNGKFHGKRAPTTRFTRHFNESSMLFHDPLADRQSKACTLAARFRREERRENLFQILGSHPISRVGNRDFQEVEGSTVVSRSAPPREGMQARGNMENSAILHGLHRIGQKIQEKLLELPRIASEAGKVRSQILLDGIFGLRNLVTQ